MKTKQEVIKEAWGDLYNHGVGIDNNGWLSENYLTNDQCKLLNSIDSIEHTRKAAHDLGYYDSSISIYRPKSLQGIENNNGWISIESKEDLPKIGEYDMSSFELYYFTTNGLYKATDYIKWCVHIVDIQITHYRLEPIFKPNKPLY